MADEKYTMGDAVIDSYIKNLEETKKDPKKRQEFLDQFAKRRQSEGKPVPDFGTPAKIDDSLEGSTPTPLNKDNKPEPGDGTVSEPADSQTEDDDEDEDEPEEEQKPRRVRVIPTGDDGDIEKAKKRKDVKTQDDVETQTDAERLFVTLKRYKVPNPEFITKNWIKFDYPTPKSSARRLVKLLRVGGTAPRTIKTIVIDFFDLDDRQIDSLFPGPSDGEDSDSDTPDDSDEIVELPLTNPRTGELMIDRRTGAPIFRRMKKGQAWWMMQNMGGVSRGGSGNDALELATAIANAQKSGDSMAMKLLAEQRDSYRQSLQRNPLEDLKNQKTALLELGLVGPRESQTDINKQMAQEVRTTFKELITETREDLKGLFEGLRDDVIKPELEKRKGNGSNNSDKPDDADIPEEQQEGIFKELEHNAKESK